jgi:hypothetical protein
VLAGKYRSSFSRRSLSVKAGKAPSSHKWSVSCVRSDVVAKVDLLSVRVNARQLKLQPLSFGGLETAAGKLSYS